MFKNAAIVGNYLTGVKMRLKADATMALTLSARHDNLCIECIANSRKIPSIKFSK